MNATSNLPYVQWNMPQPTENARQTLKQSAVLILILSVSQVLWKLLGSQCPSKDLNVQLREGINIIQLGIFIS
jgi:hypothetical protein